MSTLTELVTRTADRLSMVAGTGVQTYAEDRIAEMIQHKFDVLFEEAFWPQFLTWATFTLDGTLGIVTTDLTSLLKRYEDIRVVFPESATGDIVVQYRTKPDTFVSTDEIYFDDQALILGATFDYLEDDGTNPNASQKFQLLFEARVKQLKNTFNSAPISLDPVTALPQTFSFVELP